MKCVDTIALAPLYQVLVSTLVHYSAPFHQQVYLDAFSSPDLVHWTKHPRILDTAAVKWAHRALWAPAIVQKSGKYYLFFGANDYHPEKPNEPPGGIGAVRRSGHTD